MRAENIIVILNTLYKFHKTTSRELANKMNVCERTVYRYINELTCCGIPIEMKRGNNGGIYLYKGAEE